VFENPSPPSRVLLWKKGENICLIEVHICTWTKNWMHKASAFFIHLTVTFVHRHPFFLRSRLYWHCFVMLYPFSTAAIAVRSNFIFILLPTSTRIVLSSIPAIVTMHSAAQIKTLSPFSKACKVFGWSFVSFFCWGRNNHKIKYANMAPNIIKCTNHTRLSVRPVLLPEVPRYKISI